MADEKPYLTITLTNAQPIKIKKDEWPIVAEGTASDYDNQYEFRANRKSKMAIRVRQHSDGRAIVYGTYSHDTQFQNERNVDRRGGEMLTVQGVDSEHVGDTGPIIEAIHRVAASLAERIGEDHFGLNISEVGNQCIADLPAREV